MSQQLFNISMSRNSSRASEIEYAEVIQHTITLSQVFNLTPSADQVLKECKTRDARKYNIDEFKDRDCYNQFNVSKFYTQGN